MSKRYQSRTGKSMQNFEAVGGREVALRLPLPLAEVWEGLQAEVERLMGEAGLKILNAILEDEVTRRVGPPHRPDPAGGAVRWGRQGGYVVFAGQKVALERPRLRTRAGEELPLASYQKLQQDGRMQRAVAERMVAGLSTRKYRRAVETVLEGYGIRRSSVSRHFVRATAQQLQQLCQRSLKDLELVAVLVDGIEFAGQVMIVVLGLGENGAKRVLGLWQGATENATVAKALLEDLVARGLDPGRRYLFVLDGSKALRAAVEKVFGERAEVQRCRLHKIRNVLEQLPDHCRTDWRRRLRAAYSMTDYGAAKAVLEKLWRQLVEMNPSAARSLAEGMEETLTVHRLSVGARLQGTLASTNPIESCLSQRRNRRLNAHYRPGRPTRVERSHLPVPVVQSTGHDFTCIGVRPRHNLVARMQITSDNSLHGSAPFFASLGRPWSRPQPSLRLEEPTPLSNQLRGLCVPTSVSGPAGRLRSGALRGEAKSTPPGWRCYNSWNIKCGALG